MKNDISHNMVMEVEKVIIEPWWILIFIFGYFIAWFMFTRTNSIFKAGIFLCAWMMLIAHLIYYYYSV